MALWGACPPTRFQFLATMQKQFIALADSHPTFIVARTANRTIVFGRAPLALKNNRQNRVPTFWTSQCDIVAKCVTENSVAGFVYAVEIGDLRHRPTTLTQKMRLGCRLFFVAISRNHVRIVS